MTAVTTAEEVAIAPGSDDVGDAVIRGAEKYIEQHAIRRLLTSLLLELAQHQPPDPIAALQEYLAALDRGAACRHGAMPGGASHVHQNQTSHPKKGDLPSQEQQQQRQHVVAEDHLPPTELQHQQQEPSAKTAVCAEQVAFPTLGGEGPLSLECDAGSGNQAAASSNSGVPHQTHETPAAGSAERPLQTSVEPVEECDLDDNQAVPPLDPMQLLLGERMPTSSSLSSMARTAAGKAYENGPTKLDLSTNPCWAGGFNRWLLEGWVPQPSPCCAAASVAGAFNAIWGHGRRTKGCATVRECADLMADHCDQLREQRQQRLERLLGVAEGAFDDFLLALDTHLEASGFKWTARIGPKAITKAGALAAVHKVLLAVPQATSIDGANSGDGCDGAEAVPSQCNAPCEEKHRDIFVALREVLGTTLDGAAGSEASEPGGCDGAIPALPTTASADEPSGSAVVSLNCQCNMDWKHELQELLTKRKAVFRLRAEKPNTSEVGSWGVKQAAEALACARGVEPLRVNCLLGRKGGGTKGVEIPVSKNDDEAAFEKQWSAVKAAFGRPHTALIFHLTNHYALIFAWREWMEEVIVETAEAAVEQTGAREEPSAIEATTCSVSDGFDHGLPSNQLRWRLRRQLLTTRRGQRPSVWIDFEEVRSIIAGWSGYNLLVLQRLKSN